MRNFNNKFRGYTISIDEISQDRVEYKILSPDKSLVEDSEGYCVTIDEAMEVCKEFIDDLIDLKMNRTILLLASLGLIFIGSILLLVDGLFGIKRIPERCMNLTPQQVGVIWQNGYLTGGINVANRVSGKITLEQYQAQRKKDSLVVMRMLFEK